MPRRVHGASLSLQKKFSVFSKNDYLYLKYIGVSVIVTLIVGIKQNNFLLQEGAVTMKSMKQVSSPTFTGINTCKEDLDVLQDDSELEASTATQSVQIEVSCDQPSKSTMSSESEKETSIQKSPRTRFRKMYLVALAALMNAFCMGFGGTYTATATTDMKRPESIIRPTQDQIGWMGSLLPLGALFGGMVAGHLAQSLGRKGTLLFSSVPFTTGWLLIAYATSVIYIYAGRFIIGFCCGIVSVTTPMYLVEISTPDVRGLLGASFQLFVTIGILAVDCLGSTTKWMTLAVSGACISITTMTLILFIPESPRWLMAKNKREKALWAVKLLQGDFLDAEEECKSIQDDINSQPKGRFKCKELLAPDVYKPAILSFSLMFFQQYSSVNAILFYSGAIFEKAGSSMPSNVCTIIVALMQFFATALSSVLMDKAGRKVLLLISGTIMTISLALFGAFDLFAINSGSLQHEIRIKYGMIPLFSLIMFISAFSLGFGPIPWLMVSEMTTPRLRSAISGVATALNWTFAFAVTNTYNNLTEAMGDYGTYFFYSTICLSSCLFTFFFIPETKGKDMESIRLYFLPKRHRKSVKMSQEISEIIHKAQHQSS